MEEKRIFDILTTYLQKHPNQEVALAKKENGEWNKYSIQRYVETTNIISYALIKLGIQKDDNAVVFLADSRVDRHCDGSNLLYSHVHDVPFRTVAAYDSYFIVFLDT